MNLAATPQRTDPNLLLAAFASSTPAAPPSGPSSSPFVSLIQLLTQPTGAAQGSLDLANGTDASANSAASGDSSFAAATSPYAAPTADTIADSIIRAMLGGSNASYGSASMARTDAGAGAPVSGSGGASADSRATGDATGSLSAAQASDVNDAAPASEAAALTSNVEAPGAANLADTKTNRKRKEIDLTAASGVTSFPAPMPASFSQTNSMPNGAASASTTSASQASGSATPSSNSPASNLRAQPLASDASASPGRGAALAFGANITTKASQNDAADGTQAAAQGSAPSPGDFSKRAFSNPDSSNQSFSNNDASGNDSRGLPAAKANAASKPASDAWQQSAVSTGSGEASSQNSQQPGFVTNSAALTAVAPVAFSPSAPGAPSHAPSAAPDTAASVSAALSANAPVAGPSLAASTSAAPQQMTLRVSPPSGDANTIDIRVAQRAGQMQVTVHTDDPALQANLRQDLPELVQSLDRAGFNAETFVQRTTVTSLAGSAFNQGAFNQGSNSQGSGGSASDSRAFGGGTGSGGSKESPLAGQQFSGQHSSEEQSSGQNARDRQSERWLEQIEE